MTTFIYYNFWWIKQLSQVVALNDRFPPFPCYSNLLSLFPWPAQHMQKRNSSTNVVTSTNRPPLSITVHMGALPRSYITFYMRFLWVFHMHFRSQVLRHLYFVLFYDISLYFILHAIFLHYIYFLVFCVLRHFQHFIPTTRVCCYTFQVRHISFRATNF